MEVRQERFASADWTHLLVWYCYKWFSGYMYRIVAKILTLNKIGQLFPSDEAVLEDNARAAGILDAEHAGFQQSFGFRRLRNAVGPRG